MIGICGRRMAIKAQTAKRGRPPGRPRALSLCALPLRLLYGQQIKIGGVLLKSPTVKYVMRSRPDEAEETLERLIDQARAAITEGRASSNRSSGPNAFSAALSNASKERMMQ